MYDIIYSPKVTEDLLALKRSEPAAYKKAGKFIAAAILLRTRPSPPAPPSALRGISLSVCL